MLSRRKGALMDRNRPHNQKKGRQEDAQLPSPSFLLGSQPCSPSQRFASGIRKPKIVYHRAADEEQEETRNALKITLFFASFCGKGDTKEWAKSNTGAPLFSLSVCGESRNSPICPGVYCKRSTAPQSRFFRLLIFVAILLFFFLRLVPQFLKLFHQLVDYETNLQIRCFGGLAEVTAS